MKKFVAFFLLLPLLLLPATADFSFADPGFTAIPITAPSAILLDGNSRVIFAKTPYLRRAPASTTKILTAMVAIDKLGLNQIVRVPGVVEKIPPSKIYLKRGEEFYVRDLLRAMLINSANDAAEVLAVAAAGSRPGFINQMNQKAKSLGCKRSHFATPNGLPHANQYSTAYDMALIVRAAQQYPFLMETLKTRTAVIRSRRGRRIFLRNHNKMLWRAQERVVGKTGWTRAARHCFVGRIQLASKKVFVSILGSRRLWHDLKTLLNYQFGWGFFRERDHQKVAARHERQKKSVRRRSNPH